MAWLLDCVSFVHDLYSTYVMGHTGTLRMIVLLHAVINSAKPYAFSQVHVYVHKLCHCFKYLYNRCMGAFRNCHRVALCKCARETLHSFTKQEIATLYGKKNHSSILKIKHRMVLQKRILQPFARKKHCTVLHKRTLCLGLPNGRHPPFAKNTSVHSFSKTSDLAWFSKAFCTRNKHCMVLQIIKRCMVLKIIEHCMVLRNRRR